MSNKCHFCGKGTTFGNNVPRKGLFKKKGGTGSNIGVKTRRTFKANLQNKRIQIGKAIKRVKICTRCLRTQQKLNA
jgi:large subunit ribosomal protein L28